ncbi:MAG: Peptidyl-tRNA hydrolase [Microgenomates bacterium OLB22]|nr:MAG: Peptidyl-tRNA hydrolase [Microgenomates bacterium OLB22]
MLSYSVKMYSWYTSDMKLIVGLGNPGTLHERDRHTVGFHFLDYIYSSSEIIQPWQNSINHRAELAVIKKNDLPVKLAKPQTYMNRSGVAVRSLINFFQIPAKQVFLVYDDLDLPLGTFKISSKSYPKIHNGVNSVLEQCGGGMTHVRIGIDGRDGERVIPGERYVLSSFRPEERQVVKAVFDEITSALEKLLV